jgi:hypothetical protein
MSAPRILISCLIALGTLATQARDFTDASGRKLAGEIIAASGGQVTIKRTADGKAFTVPATTFSADDQKFIAEFAAKPLSLPFEVKYTKTKLGKTKGRDGVFTIETEEWAYKVALTNKSSMDLEGATIGYWLFRRADEGGATRNGARIETKGATSPVPIRKGATHQFQTSSFTLTKEQLDADYYNPDGTSNTKKDGAGGFALRVFKDGKAVFSWAAKPELLKMVPETAPDASKSASDEEEDK